MKRIILTLITILMIAGSPLAIAGTTLKCTVTEVLTPILPEGQGSVLLECDELEEIQVGDTVKVKIKKPKSAAIEGC